MDDILPLDQWLIGVNVAAGTFGRNKNGRSYQTDCLLICPQGAIICDFKEVPTAKCYFNKEWDFPDDRRENFYTKGDNATYQIFDWFKKSLERDVKGSIWIDHCVFFTQNNADIFVDDVKDGELSRRIITSSDNIPKKLNDLMAGRKPADQNLLRKLWLTIGTEDQFQNVSSNWLKLEHEQRERREREQKESERREREDRQRREQEERAQWERDHQRRLRLQQEQARKDQEQRERAQRAREQREQEARQAQQDKELRGLVVKVVGFFVLAMLFLFMVYGCLGHSPRRPGDEGPTAYAPQQQVAVPASPPSQSFPTSFDCRKARLWDEIAICTDAGLASLDRDLGERYSQLLDLLSHDGADSLKQEQRDWIQSRRSKCARSADSTDCLRSEFTVRLNRLNTEIDDVQNNPAPAGEYGSTDQPRQPVYPPSSTPQTYRPSDRPSPVEGNGSFVSPGIVIVNNIRLELAGLQETSEARNVDALNRLVNSQQPLTCWAIANKNRCSTSGGVDLAAAVVKNGLALNGGAYPDEEKFARKQHLGIWQ